MGRYFSSSVVPAAHTDSWPTKCLNTVSKWKNRTITYLKNTDVYQFFNKNLFSPFLNLRTTHPVIYAVALATLSILVVVLTFNLALSALKQTVSVIVPITIIVLYSQMLLSLAHNIFQAQQAFQKANV